MLSKKILKSRDPEAIYRMNRELKDIETKLKTSYNDMRRRKEDKVIPLIKNDPSIFYSYAKGFNNLNEGIGPLIDEEKDESTSNEERMAELLSNQYSKMFSNPATNIENEDIEAFFNIQISHTMDVGACGPSGGRGGAHQVNEPEP